MLKISTSWDWSDQARPLKTVSITHCYYHTRSIKMTLGCCITQEAKGQCRAHIHNNVLKNHNFSSPNLHPEASGVLFVCDTAWLGILWSKLFSPTEKCQLLHFMLWLYISCISYVMSIYDSSRLSFYKFWDWYISLIVQLVSHTPFQSFLITKSLFSVHIRWVFFNNTDVTNPTQLFLDGGRTKTFSLWDQP